VEITDLHLSKYKDGDCWEYSVGKVFKPYKEHIHEELEVNVVVSGHAKVLISGQNYNLNPGNQCWFFPKQPHILIDASLDFKMWVLVFKNKLLKRLVVDGADPTLLSDSIKGNYVKEHSDKEHNELLILCQNAFLCKNEKALFNASIAYSCLKLWSCFKSAKENIQPIQIPLKIQKAISFIHENPLISLNQLCDNLNIEQTKLSRLFKKSIGQKLSHYRQQKALENFLITWQKEPNLNLLTAALESGFGSYAQFHRVFKNNFGCGPAEFKRKSLC
jgi:AraC-like DNA-binding protein